jgi:hypothetical protein
MSIYKNAPWHFESTPDKGVLAHDPQGTFAEVMRDQKLAADRLIAAAPDLLESLLELVIEYEPNMKAFALNAPRKQIWERAAAAIAKATVGD